MKIAYSLFFVPAIGAFVPLKKSVSNSQKLYMSTTTATTSSGMSFLSEVPVGPPDAILGIAQAFRESTDPNKVRFIWIL